jgi:hypothetical protein
VSAGYAGSSVTRLTRLTRASTDREGGWQLIYRMLNSGELVICGDTCPQLVQASPTRIHDPKKPGDILKIPGDYADDVVDAFRYALYSYVNASEVRKPAQIRIAEATEHLDPTSAYLQRRRIAAEAMREEEEEPWMYSRNASRLFRRQSRRRL